MFSVIKERTNNLISPYNLNFDNTYSSSDQALYQLSAKLCLMYTELINRSIIVYVTYALLM